MKWAVTKICEELLSSRICSLFLFLMLAAIPGFAQETNTKNSHVYTPKRAPHGTIQFESLVFDFGTVMAGDTVEHKFTFTNSGAALLQLRGVYPGCSCTTVRDYTREVDPGRTGRVELRLDSTRFSGPISEHATVACDDPEHSSVNISFKGTVVKPIELSPGTAVLKPLSGSAVAETNIVKIISHIAEPVVLDLPKCDSPFFAADLSEVVKGREFNLVIRTIPPNPAAMGQGNVTIRTSSLKIPLLSVSVLCMPRSVLKVSPAQVVIPAAPVKEPLGISVAIHSEAVEEVSLSKPGCVVLGIDCEIEEVKKGRDFQLKIHVPTGAVIPSKTEAFISIPTSLPEMPFLKIPLMQAGAAGR